MTLTHPWEASLWAERTTAGPTGANQDGIWSDRQTGWVAVIDGGGPEGAGAQATAHLIRFLSGRLAHCDRSDDREVRTLIADANRDLIAAMPNQRVSATLALARVMTDRLQIWHVGDVRTHLWRGGELTQVTHDHCLANLLIARGQLTREQARQHQASRTLLRSLGKPQPPEPEYTEVPLQAGDRILICSDGLHAAYGDDAVSAGISQPSLQAAMDWLWQAAATDDRAAVLIEVPGATPEPELGRDQVFNRLFEIITKTADPESLLTEVLAMAVEVSHGDRGYIFLIEEDGSLDCRVRSGAPMPTAGEAVSRSIIQRVVQDGKALWVGDAQHEQFFSQQASIMALNLHAVLCVPLKVPKGDTEEVAGVLYVDRMSPMEILEDLRLLEILANYAGVIIQNGALYASTRIQNERLQILNSLSRSISNSTDIDRIMQEILANALRVSGADEALVLLGPSLTYRNGLTRSGEPPDTSHLSQSALRHVATELKSLCVLDATVDEQWAQQASVKGLDLRTVMCVPLLENGSLSGALYVSGRAAVNGFTKGDLEFLEALAAHASVALATARLIKQQQEQIEQMEYVLRLYQQAQHQAVTDELTGVHNRAFLEEQYTKHFEAARRYVEPLTVVMFDLDHFKQINDSLGHPAGDAVLRRVGRLLIENCRGSDIVGRYGGEEFLIVLPHTTLDVGLALAESIWQAVRTSHDTDGGPAVTISVGLSTIGESGSPADLIKAADDALYQAKAQGRDRIVVADTGTAAGR
jgi:diguanylate cyclase (GGDEF)-like protein